MEMLFQAGLPGVSNPCHCSAVLSGLYSQLLVSANLFYSKKGIIFVKTATYVFSRLLSLLFQVGGLVEGVWVVVVGIETKASPSI